MIKENMIITLETGGRYLLLHEINEIDNKKYYYAVGVTEDDDINQKDTVFFEAEEENGESSVTMVDPASDIYKALTAIELFDSKVEDDPRFEARLDEFINAFENQTSSN